MLNSAEIARARQHTYQLLSRLFLEGVSAEIYPFLAEIPALVPYLDSADDPAATHFNLFHFDIFPYESIFCDTTALVGGHISALAAGAWHASGLTAPTEPDHIGQEVALLAFLAAAEADAWRDGLPVQAARMQQQQSTLLASHLLRWSSAFVCAVQQTTEPLYAKSAELLWAVVADHADALQVKLHPPFDFLPEPPDLLANDRTGLKDVCNFLMLPAQCGVWLGRDAIARIARACNLPRGFGSRFDMLLTLLRSAAAYGMTDELLTAIGRLAQLSATQFAGLTTSAPHLSPFVAPWESRARNTGALLHDMRTLASAVSWQSAENND